MAMLPFQVTVSQNNETSGTKEILWNVQAADVDAFVRNIQDLGARVPRFRALVGDVFNTAQVREQLTGQAREPVNIRTAADVPAAVAAATAQAMPQCAKHATSKRSKFYTGLICPKKDGDRYCDWEHKCDAACMHPAIQPYGVPVGA